MFAAAPLASTAEPEGVVGWVLDLMERLGEVGVGVAVFAETFLPPIPSEAVLPVAGFLAYEGRMNPWWAIAAATTGAVVGAWLWWLLGAMLGRERTRALVARVPLLGGEDFDKADAFFARWGAAAVLFGRCVPLVRSFISIPAGIQRMPFWRFTLYTTLGSGVWNALWIGLGYALGPAMEPVLTRWSGVLSDVVVIGVGLVLVLFVAARLRGLSRRAKSEAQDR
ncbi:DedA family protein [Nocardioides sp. R-C-SC26]|uniref:DedA family protein n=1 Tax=Nocardioides sp. R-C-SC26 TaxID=2870414 RepID=UPI001E527D82|nr:DedA family protein [Nocardioides sp. R-C-SC26]